MKKYIYTLPDYQQNFILTSTPNNAEPQQTFNKLRLQMPKNELPLKQNK